MPTQLIQPRHPQRFEIRCNVGDALVANLAVHLVFFFPRQLDARALASAFAQALTRLPLFAGRLGMRHGRMRIRCAGQGVPFTTVSSECTLPEAIRSISADTGGWLVDPVNGPVARWSRGPLCTVRVTQLANAATAIGFSWHHALGDMQTAMHMINAWVAAAAGKPAPDPLIVEDRAAYLDEHLPADGAREPGVRVLGFAELARSAAYLATKARSQRTLHLYFSDGEIARIRGSYGSRMRLSSNDVVCAHMSETLMRVDPVVDRRSLAIAVNTRTRCGLDPMLVGNILTTLNLNLRRGEAASSIAERIRHSVDHFGAEHCDMRINQQYLDAAGTWQAARCVSTAFDPVRWNPLITNWSGFGVYRVNFEDTWPSYCTPLMRVPVAGLGSLMEWPDGNGLVFQMSLPPRDFEALSSPVVREYLHRCRCAGDVVARSDRDVHG
ncbi:acyltransferase [Mycobacterium sp. UM_Kg1]|uniref:acyltransferase n=1 Tax=Mycobacterium sp. UM_Kg1 TaxID=1545691 RepID=UPI00061B1F9A|nr:acyltransferase [Mycobacterium sp. UM_Kg1]